MVDPFKHIKFISGCVVKVEAIVIFDGVLNTFTDVLCKTARMTMLIAVMILPLPLIWKVQLPLVCSLSSPLILSLPNYLSPASSPWDSWSLPQTLYLAI